MPCYGMNFILSFLHHGILAQLRISGKRLELMGRVKRFVVTCLSQPLSNNTAVEHAKIQTHNKRHIRKLKTVLPNLSRWQLQHLVPQ
jgi:hypothetical protein